MSGGIEALLDAMTVEEQISLLAGGEFWTTVPIPRLKIPAIKVTDGPNGARAPGRSSAEEPSTWTMPKRWLRSRRRKRSHPPGRTPLDDDAGATN